MLTKIPKDSEGITDPDPERIPDALQGIGYYIGITTAPQGCGYHIAHQGFGYYTFPMLIPDAEHRIGYYIGSSLQR